jgi:uncharacterized protein YjiS (DUF1127 family)
MSYLSFTGLAASPLAAAFGVVEQTWTSVGRLWRAHENRRAVRDLKAYDERMLKDIGLTPGDVDAALDSPIGVDPSQHLRQVAAGRARRR